MLFIWGDRLIITEKDKERTKIKARREYLNRHSIRSVSAVVMKHYFKYCNDCRFCYKKARYIFFLDDDIYCANCEKIQYYAGYVLIVCRPGCTNGKWRLDDFPTTSATYAPVRDCIHCGSPMKNVALFVEKY